MTKDELQNGIGLLHLVMSLEHPSRALIKEAQGFLECLSKCAVIDPPKQRILHQGGNVLDQDFLEESTAVE